MLLDKHPNIPNLNPPQLYSGEERRAVRSRDATTATTIDAWQQDGMESIRYISWRNVLRVCDYRVELSPTLETRCFAPDLAERYARKREHVTSIA